MTTVSFKGYELSGYTDTRIHSDKVDARVRYKVTDYPRIRITVTGQISSEFKIFNLG